MRAIYCHVNCFKRYIYIYLTVYLSICLYLSLCIYVCLSIRYLYLSMDLSVYLQTCKAASALGRCHHIDVLKLQGSCTCTEVRGSMPWPAGMPPHKLTLCDTTVLSLSQRRWLDFPRYGKPPLPVTGWCCCCRPGRHPSTRFSLPGNGDASADREPIGFSLDSGLWAQVGSDWGLVWASVGPGPN